MPGVGHAMSPAVTRHPTPDARPVRAVLFDYGGTLDGAASHWLDRFVGLYREAAAEVPFDALKRAFYEADRAAYAEPRVRSMSLAELMEFHVRSQLAALRIDDAALRRFLVERFVDSSRAALAESRTVLAELAEHYALGVVSNISDQGACVVTDGDFPVGESLVLQLVFSPEAQPFQAAGRVVWIKPAADTVGGHRYGLQWAHRTGPQHARLRELIASAL